MKRLASVETLGCTSVICSDKTGTLTLNEMTAVELVSQLRRHEVTGDGYAPGGRHRPRRRRRARSRSTPRCSPMALCNDAAIREVDDRWDLVGDPTEGALVVLAAKGGLDVDDLRANHPRLAEVPFDSANKFMATVHELVDRSGRTRRPLFVKGAPDVLLARSSRVIGTDGGAEPDRRTIDDARGAQRPPRRPQGLRVLAVAQREFSLDDWARVRSPAAATRSTSCDDLTLVALVGIVDPPRPEAAIAIAEAHARRHRR